MQIDIDPLSDVPLYQQLRDRVVEGIASGLLLPGEQLASVRQLAVAFGINVATVSKAYDLLRHEGLIRTNHKSGSVVARGPGDSVAANGFVDDWQSRLTTLLAEACVQGLSSSQISESVDQVLAGFTRSAEGDRT
ncbi:MAG: GntR family transcriptional regulator [Microbacteriaceae bacterium]|nr:MAG: GntR family transcriptional regulator [Microbacteriaceae bacterium]